MTHSGSFILFAIILLGALNVFPQNPKSAEKHHYRAGVIPVCSYDADLGLKIGAVFNLFEFRQNQQDYSQYLILRSTYTTSNTLNLQVLLESASLIKNATSYIEASYTHDRYLDFYGFNGIESVYFASQDNVQDPLSKPGNFYSLNRKLLRLRWDVQKQVFGQWYFLGGLTCRNFRLESNAQNTPTLFDLYEQWGIIDKHELNGGASMSSKIGFVYDSRNNKCNTKSGHWLESFWLYSVGFNNEKSFSKWIVNYRFYTSFWDDWLTLAFRISSQSKTSGEIPHYLLPIQFDTRENQDGLGGAYSLRGIARNRIVANGYALSNVESRFKIVEFSWMLDFEVSGTLFADVATITQPYNYSAEKIPENDYQQYFSTKKQTFYTAFGPGINLIYNQNNIITMNYGFSTNRQLGSGGLYIGSRFLF
ncbi:MAG: hypothetical protein JW842_03580 [Prolixibacteraceae bacterium]|nr:hypothetical protein [Prolixibacteraceae bacterium]